ncbi:hypothetical protein VKT23_010169 [Stygiomarasmius scandens]|uniref:GPI anchored protein n=1 Tax=Marasmiellus scandens TaxID=2682957 RepID=A0ABR1JGB5_9AGAR
MVRILTIASALLSVLVVSAQGAELRATIDRKQATSHSIIRGLIKRQSACDPGFGSCPAVVGGGCCPIGGKCCPDGSCCDTGTLCVNTPSGQIGCCPVGQTCFGEVPDDGDSFTVGDGSFAGSTSQSIDDTTAGETTSTAPTTSSTSAQTSTQSANTSTATSTAPTTSSTSAQTSTQSANTSTTTSAAPTTSSTSAQTSTQSTDTSTTTDSPARGNGGANKSTPTVPFFIAAMSLWAAIAWF